MFKTRITEMLGIEYPILQGGMQWLSKAELASAVSEAGGMGFITAASFADPEELRDEIHKIRSLTKKPFGINVSMLPVLMEGDITRRYVEVIAEEKVPAVETSGRNPEPFVPALKEAGVKIIHKVPAVRFARKAESIGADAVTIVGFECGGHPGMDDVTSFILIPRTAESLNIPVVAGGGIADARGFVAALSLGAEGVVMGTRFLAAKECPAHQNFKEWIVAAQETDTMMIERSIRNAVRVMKNEVAQKVLEMENKGATLDELIVYISGMVGKQAWLNGDLDSATIAAGQCVGLIHEVLTVKEIIDNIVTGAHQILGRLNGIMQ
ncbi:MAG: nitronate monooxygenase [Candidatus Abyssobacteria bacterium SURF_17]|uniref:Nitronate monooxygenase n=1 Tax=Candidatus Abyssobacteria bacterium SURF_17 TaxID=2093361 RepID=A0A419F1E3_9BACT|nr:MAG: nitronate monooxygenase [Candidatus Abyssubacteria bacterium SURF_17]